ncbi:MAG: hypothetical protein Q7S02_05180 [bacterium]|nr:hypothetical protein [bacterium]
MHMENEEEDCGAVPRLRTVIERVVGSLPLGLTIEELDLLRAP